MSAITKPKSVAARISESLKIDQFKVLHQLKISGPATSQVIAEVLPLNSYRIARILQSLEASNSVEFVQMVWDQARKNRVRLYRYMGGLPEDYDPNSDLTPEPVKDVSSIVRLDQAMWSMVNHGVQSRLTNMEYEACLR